MTITSNISHTHGMLEDREETNDVDIDGNSDGALFRTMVDTDDWDSFEDFVEEELEVEVRNRTYTPYGFEAELGDSGRPSPDSRTLSEEDGEIA